MASKKRISAYEWTCFNCGKKFSHVADKKHHAKICAMFSQHGIQRLK